MDSIETIHISKIDNVETREALELLKKEKQRTLPLLIFGNIFAGITIFFLITIIYTNEPSIIILIDLITITVSIVLLSARKNILKPYKELLILAKRNDLIRHEEKIREKERQRLRKQLIIPPKPPDKK